MKPGTLFTATSKIGFPHTYKLIAINKNELQREFILFDTQEKDNPITEVEKEWFNQRTIEVLSNEM